MLVPALLLTLACGAQSSDVHHELPAGAAPIVTASSSQYFERTFNRLVAAPPLHVIPVAPAPPVIVEAKRNSVIPVNPTNPPQVIPADPNIAIAIATAQAAPVATFLLPPYPFGFPPSYGLVPQPSDTNNKESTTPITTTIQATTEREPESTTASSSNIDNSFAQALPSNENINFKQYGLPLPVPRQKPQELPLPVPRQKPQELPLPIPRQKPQKIKTSVEVVPVPLAYIAPPPLDLHHHHHHGHHHHYQALKFVPHVHTYIPKTAKIIIRPASPRIRIVRVPKKYSIQHISRKSQDTLQNIKSRSRDVEETTIRPINRPATKPPRL